MFVITADQIGSRRADDLVVAAIDTLTAMWDDALERRPERTAGDELQLVTRSPAAALGIVLDLTRTGDWSVGCGVGAVRTPLPESVRAATGDAFVAAREAVERAKHAPTRAAVAAIGATRDADDAGALLDLLLVLRARRSAEGWEVVDLLAAGGTQQDAARRLGITPQAVSRRAIAAGLRTETAATGALARLLARADDAATAHADGEG